MPWVLNIVLPCNHALHPVTHTLKGYQRGNVKQCVHRLAHNIVGTLFLLKLDITYNWHSFKMLQVHELWADSSYEIIYNALKDYQTGNGNKWVFKEWYTFEGTNSPKKKILCTTGTVSKCYKSIVYEQIITLQTCISFYYIYTLKDCQSENVIQCVLRKARNLIGELFLLKLDNM